MEPTEEEPGVAISGRVARLRSDLIPLYTVTAAVLFAAGGWYLLKELAPLFRPLVLAVFLVYTILPAHQQSLGQRVHANLAGPLLVLLVAAAILGLAAIIYGNLVDLQAELPRLIDRARGLIERLRTWGHSHLPAWAFEAVPDTARAEGETTARLKALASGLVNIGAAFFGEALVVGFYLVFLLLEVRRFPRRIRGGSARNRPITCSRSSRSTARPRTLRAKVLSSLATALPVVAILWTFGVSFPGMWGVLAFVGNFIPYAGSLVAFASRLAGVSRARAALATFGGSRTAPAGAVCDQQPRGTAADRSRCEPQSAGGADRPGVLGPLLGGCRYGAGRTTDGDAENRV